MGMTRPIDGVEIDELLRQMSWVRALARSLVNDAESRDDVVQDAWLFALRCGHGVRDVRAWWKSVVSGLAKNAGRRDRSRTATESAGAKMQSVRESPDPTDLVVAAERQRELVRIVLLLDANERTVILEHYFRGRSLEEIARANGEPAPTVRSRLRRALAKLRERLDRENGRENWLAALAPFAQRSVATGVGAALGVGSMSKVWLVAGAAFAVLFVCAWELRGPTRKTATDLASMRDHPDLAEGDTAGESRAAAPSIPIDVPRASEDRVETSTKAAFRGLVTDRAGKPLEGASVTLARKGSFVRPKRQGSVNTNRAGRFEIEEVSGPSAEDAADILIVELSRYASRVEKLKDSRSFTIVLDPSARILGRVLASDGQTPVANAVVEAQAQQAEGSLCEFAAPCDGQGNFIADGMPVGLLVTILVGPPAGTIERFDFTFAESGDQPLTLTLAPRTRIRGRVIDRETQAPIVGAPVSVRYWRLALGTRARYSGQPIATSDTEGNVVIDLDSEAAGHDVMLSSLAPGHAKTTIRMSSPSASNDRAEFVIALDRGATIRGRVRDAKGPLPFAQVEAHLVPSTAANSDSEASEYASIASLDQGSLIVADRMGEFEVHGVPIGRRVGVGAFPPVGDGSHRRSAQSFLEPETVRAGATIEIRLEEWDPATALEGFLTRNGKPAALEYSWSASETSRGGRTDANGHFRDDRLAPVSGTLYVRDGASSTSVEVELAAGRTTQVTVDLADPFDSHVRGIAVDSSGKPLAGCRLMIRRTVDPVGTTREFTSGEDGRFEVPLAVAKGTPIEVVQKLTYDSVRLRTIAGADDCVVKVASTGIVRVRCLDAATGKPIEQPSIAVRGLDADRFQVIAETEKRRRSDGGLEFKAGLEPIEIAVAAERNGFATTLREITPVAIGTEVEPTVVLVSRPELGSLRIEFVDDPSAPRPNSIMLDWRGRGERAYRFLPVENLIDDKARSVTYKMPVGTFDLKFSGNSAQPPILFEGVEVKRGEPAVVRVQKP